MIEAVKQYESPERQMAWHTVLFSFGSRLFTGCECVVISAIAFFAKITRARFISMDELLPSALFEMKTK